jgi:phage N-6-adenine-methyltransferase
MNDVHYSMNTNEWATPWAFFAALDAEFGFTLDAAASHDNAKCERYLSAELDALSQDWLGTVFCNPPYGYGIGKWVKKAYEESQRGADAVVLLIPARTCTRWWHDYVMRAEEIRLIKGRLYFGLGGDDATINAPFPSCVVVMRHGEHAPRLTTMDRILTPGHVKDHRTITQKSPNGLVHTQAVLI